ncbi:MAG: hypothetical protein KDA24_04560 [Deltaproteobacteria bacterium]|nr:hypothetical protein [Deltaproteobacteria bacterium]
MIARVLPLLAVFLTSSVEAAPLHGLLADDLAPDDRERLVAEACSAGSVTAAELSPLLSESAPRPAQLDAARIAVCRADPTLIPLMYLSYHRGKAAHLINDPDLYERLLRGLQGFGPELMREHLFDEEGQVSAHADLASLAWSRLHHDWLAPLGGDTAPRLPPDDGGLVAAEASRWLADVLDAGPDGLVRLQTDSGDHGYLFLQRLQGWYLGALEAHGSPAEVELAQEVCRQSSLCGHARDDPQRIGTPLRPVVPIEVARATTESVIPPPRRLSPLAWAWGVLAAAWGLWVLLLRSRPAWRRVLFPAGALGLAPTLLLAAEAVLPFLGVTPLASVGGAGWSEPQAMRGTADAAGTLLESRTLSGRPFRETINEGARWAAVPPTSEGSWRVVTLGESSVHASNHLREESFAEVLGRRLRADHPGQDVEVLNGGIGGAISDDVVSAAVDVLDADPDLIVLYHGINDLGRLETLAGMRAFSPWQLAVRVVLDESHVARIIHDLLPERELAPDADGAWQDESPVGGETADRLSRLAALRCTRNQQRVVRMGAARGVPVIVVAQALVTAESYPSDTERRRLLRWIAEETASRTGAVMLDAHAILGAHSAATGGPPAAGEAYFWDQLHPSRLGHAVLGEALAPTAGRLLRDRDASR